MTSAAPDSRVDPRRLVLDLLLSRDEFPTRLFPNASERRGLDPRDRALARAILVGVLRHKRTLDCIFRPYANRRRLDRVVVTTLRMAVFQRFFLHSIPDYAAFGATLDAARPRLHRSLAFVNAVLRALQRGIVEENPDGKPPARDLLAEGGRSWRFDRPLFPDPAADPVAYWAAAASFPDFLVRRWFEAVGVPRALERMRLFNRTPPLTLRINPLRSNPQEVREELGKAGYAFLDGGGDHSLILRGTAEELTRLPGFSAGHWSVQDLSAQRAVALAEVRPGERVLDLCAAPGGKTFALFEQSGGAAEIVACDVDPDRLQRLRSDRQRLGHDVVIASLGKDGTSIPEGEWDLILLDLPCSNTGVLGRRPEARWRFQSGSLRRLVGIQRRIAEGVLKKALGPRTRVLWSTCSLEPDENQQGARRFARKAGLEIQAEEPMEPDATRSGGYAALLVPAR